MRKRRWKETDETGLGLISTHNERETVTARALNLLMVLRNNQLISTTSETSEGGWIWLNQEPEVDSLLFFGDS